VHDAYTLCLFVCHQEVKGRADAALERLAQNADSKAKIMSLVQDGTLVYEEEEEEEEENEEEEEEEEEV
jgi:hypothetical protein